MPPRFSRPRLISADDKQYRAFLAEIMLGKDTHRPTRPPRARDLFGGEAEEALRGWMSQRTTLSDRRIVEYYEQRGRTAFKKYRELDAVELPDHKTVHVCEIKASSKAYSLRRAVRQLNDTRAILRMLYMRVSATILLVDTGIPTADEVAALMAEPDAPPTPPATLGDVLALLPQVQVVAGLDQRAIDPNVINLIHFSVDDIIALAGEENLHLDWDEDDEPEEAAEEAAPAEEPPADDQAPADEDDESPFAAALRQAMQRKER